MFHEHGITILGLKVPASQPASQLTGKLHLSTLPFYTSIQSIPFPSLLPSKTVLLLPLFFHLHRVGVRTPNLQTAKRHGTARHETTRNETKHHKQINKQQGSYGYEGSQGLVYNGSTSGRGIGSTFSTGDTVGLGINFKKMEV